MSMPWIGVSDAPAPARRWWDGPGAGGPVDPGDGPLLRFWDGTTVKQVVMVGWWDGTSVQPAKFIGHWNGTTLLPLA